MPRTRRACSDAYDLSELQYRGADQRSTWWAIPSVGDISLSVFVGKPLAPRVQDPRRVARDDMYTAYFGHHAPGRRVDDAVDGAFGSRAPLSLVPVFILIELRRALISRARLCLS